jgi:hypothetical protein
VDHLLQVLCLKGRATHEALGVAVEADATAAIADLGPPVWWRPRSSAIG